MPNGNPAPGPLNSRYFRPVRGKETRASRWDLQFESTSLQQRVVQTIGSSAVELTSLILGRSVRVTSATHGEAELEDTVRALRKPGVSGRSGFSPPARAAD